MRYHVPCPHPDCSALIGVADGLPAGEYDCRCRSCKVRVSWTPYADRDSPPRLDLAQTAQNAPVSTLVSKRTAPPPNVESMAVSVAHNESECHQ